MEAAENGAPVSEITTAHLIASLQANGRHIEASRYVKEYNKAWPGSRIEKLMARLFRDQTHADNLINHMKAADWGNKHEQALRKKG